MRWVQTGEITETLKLAYALKDAEDMDQYKGSVRSGAMRAHGWQNQQAGRMEDTGESNLPRLQEEC